MVTLRSPIRTRPSDTQGEVRVQLEGGTKATNSHSSHSRLWTKDTEVLVRPSGSGVADG